MTQHPKSQIASADHPNQAKNQGAQLHEKLNKIGRKYIVMSGKGGVGKTSVAVNLAMALANRGARVGLMDVDIHGPDIPRMLGQRGVLELSQDHKLRPMPFSNNLAAVSIEALNNSKDDAIIWRGPMKHSIIRQFITEVEWGRLDYLIIDAPPGTGDEPLSVAQTIKEAQAIIVTTPQEVSLADVRKSINFCRIVKLSIRGLIENMSGLACPHCQAPLELFGTGGGERTASAANIPFLGRIPFDPRMVRSSDSGISFQKAHPDAPAAKALAQIAVRIAQGG